MNHNTTQTAKTQRTLHMIPHNRTAGSIPIWKNANTEQSKTLSKFSNIETPSHKLAYQSTQKQNANQPFNFSDLIDMVNPLQHIPLVGHLYRDISGDTIKPSSKIIGGAVFAGPLGAVSGLIDVVIIEETGQDLTSNTINYIKHGQKPTLRATKNETQQTVDTLNWNNPDQTIQPKDTNDFPATLLAFVDLSHSETPSPKQRGIIQTRYND